MKNEIEAKFVNIDIDDMRHKLKGIGATLIQPLRDMKRITIDNSTMQAKNAFLRVRDEGNKTTMTYKQFDDLSLDGVREIEVEVSDFHNTVALLAEAGLLHGSSQESRRETWSLEGVEIVIDEWPWLNPYIEIEGPDEASVINTAQKLGFNWDEALFGDVMVAYRAQYPHLTPNDTVGNIPKVRFADPLPGLLKNSADI